ncbi:hypothetical protein MQX03_07915 [Chryseobacterium aahli]|uniref:hypothetical protein n=1 Tax=Chryseobacterium aahli TaxID=1278643 RepID=UPI001F5FF902|nr:hypothetical protein [Chryseobacterium aahli]MCI3937122.1 hypothetical protein [Chryseobacterium aahli]
MKLKILITELVFQILLSAGSIFCVIYEYFKNDQLMAFFIALFFVGCGNLFGFLIRISVIASKFHRYYFFGVIVFFFLIYLLSKFDPNVEIIFNFLGMGGVLFNLYYLIYGYFMIRKLSDEIKIRN